VNSYFAFKYGARLIRLGLATVFGGNELKLLFDCAAVWDRIAYGYE